MKKYRWLWLAVVMAFVIAACGGGDATTTTAAEGAATTEGGASTTAAEGGATTTAGAPAESTGYENLDAALAGEYEGTTVDVWAQWLPESIGSRELHLHPGALPGGDRASRSTSSPPPTMRRRFRSRSMAVTPPTSPRSPSRGR